MDDYLLFAQETAVSEKAANYYGAGVEDTSHREDHLHDSETSSLDEEDPHVSVTSEEEGYPITPRIALDLQEKAQDLAQAWMENECERVLDAIFDQKFAATSIYLGVLVYNELCLRDDMIDRTNFLIALEREL